MRRGLNKSENEMGNNSDYKMIIKKMICMEENCDIATHGDSE